MKKFLALFLVLILTASIASAGIINKNMTDEEKLYVEQQVRIDTNPLWDAYVNFTPASAIDTSNIVPAYSAIPLNTQKYNPVGFPQVKCGLSSSSTDNTMRMYKQMGVNTCELSIKANELSYEALYPVVERIRNFEEGGFEILLASYSKYQKDSIIHLQKEGWEEEINLFIDYLKLCGELKIPTVAIAWQPNGIGRTGGTPTLVHGASSGVTDMAQGFDPYALGNDRYYTREEMWETYTEFINRVLPYCEEYNVRMALHPNDPPVPYYKGCGCLIISADDYRRAFEIAGNSPYVGMKLCVGCWTEGGINFTDDMVGDILDFCSKGQILDVHFRSVTSPLNRDYSGRFEECLAIDAYADLYVIMKALVKGGYNGNINYDHIHSSVSKDELGSIYPSIGALGVIQGMIYAARDEVWAELNQK